LHEERIKLHILKKIITNNNSLLTNRKRKDKKSVVKSAGREIGFRGLFWVREVLVSRTVAQKLNLERFPSLSDNTWIFSNRD
jgi:hypothetical protein